MLDDTVTLSVPAQAQYARAVRMMASNLAAVCNMSVDEVDDVRMAAEEGFIYCCATKPSQCELSFSLLDDHIEMQFGLGNLDILEEEVEDDSANNDSTEDAGNNLSLVELLLSAVCDECFISENNSLVLTKRYGGADA